MHPWKRFWKVDVDAAYYWDEPLKLVEASEAEAALAEAKDGFKGFIEETERLHKAEVYGLKTLLAEAQARIAELEAAIAGYKVLEQRAYAAEAEVTALKKRCDTKNAIIVKYSNDIGALGRALGSTQAEVARLKAQACHVVLEHPDWAFVCKHEPAPPAPARPDADDGPCPKCGGEIGHRINCPDGIAFSEEPKPPRPDAALFTPCPEKCRPCILSHGGLSTERCDKCQYGPKRKRRRSK